MAQCRHCAMASFLWRASKALLAFAKQNGIVGFWTLMEFSRSPQIKVMLNDYRIIQDSNDVFLREIVDVWNQLGDHYGTYYTAETMAYKRGDMVSWKLGHIT